MKRAPGPGDGLGLKADKKTGTIDTRKVVCLRSRPNTPRYRVTPDLDWLAWFNRASLANRVAAHDPSPANLAALLRVSMEAPPC